MSSDRRFIPFNQEQWQVIVVAIDRLEQSAKTKEEHEIASRLKVLLNHDTYALDGDIDVDSGNALMKALIRMEKQYETSIGANSDIVAPGISRNSGRFAKLDDGVTYFTIRIVQDKLRQELPTVLELLLSEKLRKEEEQNKRLTTQWKWREHVIKAGVGGISYIVGAILVALTTAMISQICQWQDLIP